MFPADPLNEAKYGGGGNRTRDKYEAERLNQADPYDLTVFKGPVPKPGASVGGVGRPKRKRTDPNPERRAFDWADAKRRYEDGASTVEIGAALGVSSTAVGKALERMGVPRRKHWEVTKNLERANASKASRTHCPAGHEYTAENTRLGPRGRNCRQCLRTQTNERRKQMKAKGIKRLKGWSVTKKGELEICRNCGSGDRVQLHHAIPRSKSSGPSRTDLRNGVPLCHACHWGWHGRSTTIYRDIFTEDEWAFISSVELTGENIGAWLDKNYPARDVA